MQIKLPVPTYSQLRTSQLEKLTVQYSIAISYKEIMDDITTSKQENGNRKQEKPK